MFKHSVVLSAIVISSTVLWSCSSTRKQATDVSYQNSATSRAATMSGGSEFAVVEFEKGSYELSPNGRATLQKVAKLANSDNKEVEEIKVLAWADREYPANGMKAERREVNLADDRASAIKSYLKEDLNTDADIDKHNMAQRPGAFGEIVKSEDFRIKDNFENAGAAPTDDLSDMMSSKVSKAIVVIEYE